MRTQLFTALLILSFGTLTWAQTNPQQAADAVTDAIGPVGLGTALADFLVEMPTLAAAVDTTIPFRKEIEQKVGKNGLKSITYYFDGDAPNYLYELIFEFDNVDIRAGATGIMLGESNYPDKPDYWIAGAQDNIVSVGWAFDSKLVIAANLPGTEWDGDPLFSIPGGFEPNQNLPIPSEWPQEELSKLFQSLDKLILAGKTKFETLKGPETDGYFECKEPLSAAQNAVVVQDDEGKWVCSNTFVSGASMDNAVAWQLDMGKVFENSKMANYSFRKVQPKNNFGGTMDTWEILDAKGQKTGLQLGIINYEWGAEGLYSVDVMVMEE